MRKNVIWWVGITLKSMNLDATIATMCGRDQHPSLLGVRKPMSAACDTYAAA